MFRQIEWLFFDVGSTLIDESRANEHRIVDAIAGTDLSYEQAYAQAVQLARQNVAHPLRRLGLPITPWHSEDEIVYPQAAECLAFNRAGRQPLKGKKKADSLSTVRFLVCITYLSRPSPAKYFRRE